MKLRLPGAGGRPSHRRQKRVFPGGVAQSLRPSLPVARECLRRHPHSLPSGGREFGRFAAEFRRLSHRCRRRSSETPCQFPCRQRIGPCSSRLAGVKPGAAAPRRPARRSASAMAPDGRRSSAGTSRPCRSAATPARRRAQHVGGAAAGSGGEQRHDGEGRRGREAQPAGGAAGRRASVSGPSRHRAPYSSWRRHQRPPASLRPRGARSSHWYAPHRPSSPRA
jgi:hypothetical protein